MDKMRVLLVDDEVEFVSALAERLNLRGFEAQTATSGEEALAKIDQSPPDLVLLDMLMPGMNGTRSAEAHQAGPPPESKSSSSPAAAPGTACRGSGRGLTTV